MKLYVTAMTLADLVVVLDWARQEGWNPGVGDAEAFYRADPEGFLIGRIDGEPAAAISAVRYGPHYGFLGLYICRPEFRGRGYGMTMWQEAMKTLGDRVVGLDGVPAQIANYGKSGFALAYNNARFAGPLRLDAPADPRLRTVDDGLADGVVAFDAGFVPERRDRFIRGWVSSSDRTAIALVEDGAVTGYGVIREASEGQRIGPLFASSETDADILFRALCADRAGETVFIDMPLPNRGAMALAERYGMVPGFETSRMYRGPAPELPVDRIFGVTTLELG